MQFSDTTNLTGIVQIARDLSDTDSEQFPIEELTNYVNMGLDEFTRIAIMSDGNWKFDGSNHSDEPEESINLVASQANYALTTSSVELLVIERVEALDANGNYYLLRPINYDEIGDRPLSQIFNSEGDPIYYDLRGNDVFVYPTPASNRTNGLKIFYKRNVEKFVKTDTTKEPGIPSIFQPFLPVYAAYRKAIADNLANLAVLKADLDTWESKISTYYAKRNQTTNPRLRRRLHYFR